MEKDSQPIIMCATCGKNVMRDDETNENITTFITHMQNTYDDCRVLNASGYNFKCPYDNRCCEMTMYTSSRANDTRLTFQVALVNEMHVSMFSHMWESLPAWVIAAATTYMAVTYSLKP